MPATGARRGNLVYHWKHGWIPLDHFAALSKAHHSKTGAVKVMQKHGIDVPKGYKSDHTPTVKATPATEHFRMSGKELQDRAAKGDHGATAELARRAARKNAAGGKIGGKKSGVPFRPPTKPTEPKTATPKAAAPKPPERKAPEAPKAAPPAHPAPHTLKPGEFATVAGEDQYGQPTKFTGTVFSNSPTAVFQKGRVTGGVPKRAVGVTYTSPTTGNPRSTVVYVPDPSRGEQHRASPSSSQFHDAPKKEPAEPKAAEKPKAHVPGSPEHMAAIETENRQIEKSLPEGHTIGTTDLSQKYSHMAGQGPRLVHTQWANNLDSGRLDRVGSVVPRLNEFYAQSGVPGVSSQNFSTRSAAHKYLADTYESHKAQVKQAAVEKAARDARNAEANAKKAAKLSGLPGPGGKSWEPHTVTGDGTRFGDAAAAKTKQAFKSGNHTVIIETAMTKEQTKGLLSDITSVIDKAGLHQHEIKFQVPSGDRHFRTKRGGTTGAYVIKGGKTVFINPRIANNAIADKFEAGGHSGHFMEAAKTVPARQYTLTHELGHVVDNINHHTDRRDGVTPGGFSIPMGAPEGVEQMVRDHRDNLSKYGRTNRAEAYAEAFAQWTHGGPGSSVAADAFAKRFGWAVPKK